MKNIILITLLTISSAGLSGQTIPTRQSSNQSAPAADLPRFDLQFSGGTPEYLVARIRAAQKAPLNVVLPANQDEVQIPPFEVQQVTVQELFNALGKVSNRQEYIQTGFTDEKVQGNPPFGANQGASRRAPFTSVSEGFAFQTEQPISTNSVWHLLILGQSKVPETKVIRYYQLAPYLNNVNIDDITTAIQAGWKMLQVTPAPELNFHKDTQLLIAVGDAKKLDIIDAALAELAKVPPAPVKPAVETKKSE